ncbi:hypothetical protein AB0C52_28310 [Streptomyces sp. NPDC048717]|uniref:hypothetical protein n=1 Tax=Streptomyces sp. NPDC048717 TaxID=3154928 RepID=UPI00342AA6C2
MNRPPFRGFARTGLALLGAAMVSATLGTTVSTAVPSDTSSTASGVTRAAAARGCAVVYFDLGETLVHTDANSRTGYLPGAAAYLRELRARHIKVGLITNVPSSWGATDTERAAALKNVVDEEWKGSAPFAWEDFGDRILTPRTEAERKPAPALWARAATQAGGCRLVYEGETAAETAVAASLGYATYQTGRPERPAYLPVGLIEALTHGAH